MSVIALVVLILLRKLLQIVIVVIVVVRCASADLEQIAQASIPVDSKQLIWAAKTS